MSTVLERIYVNGPAGSGSTVAKEDRTTHTVVEEDRTTHTVAHARKVLKRARAQRERIRTTLSESDRSLARYRSVLRRAGLLK